MKYPENSPSIIRWFKRVWEALVEPAWIGDARERHRSRILNIILLIFLTWGGVFEIQSQVDNQVSNPGGTLALLMIAFLALAYYLNRQGHFSAALLLTLGLFITSTFASVLKQGFRDNDNLSVLYYLIIAILISDLFFSLQGYLITAAITLGGVLGISLLNPNAGPILAFLLIFCTLVGFTSYNRRSIERQQNALASRYTYDRSLLTLEQRRSAQLSLLEEAGRQITNSLDEKEILEH